MSNRKTTSPGIDSPAHYTMGGIETIKYLRAKLSAEAFKGFCIGNIIKYASRAEYKGGLEDIKKARKYCDILIKDVEQRRES